MRAIAFERPGERRLSSLLTGSHEEENDALRLTRFDSATALPSRSALESRWARFPSYDALSDSIRDEGGRLERGPVRFDLETGGVVAYQSHFAAAGRRPARARVGDGRHRRPAGCRTHAQGSVEQPPRGHRARHRGPGAGDPAGRGAGTAPPRRQRASRRRLGPIRTCLVEPPAHARPAPGFGRAVSLLARGAGTTFGGFCPGQDP